MSNVTVIGNYSKKPFTISDNYIDQYASGVANGYNVSFVRDYVNETGNTISEMYITTPYMYNDCRLNGYLQTSADAHSPKESTVCELWAGSPNSPCSKNIEDIAGISDGSQLNILLSDKNGNSINYYDALDTISHFGSAAAHYPHIKTYSEYMDVESINNQKLGLDIPVDELSYLQYLNSCENDITERNKYIGKTDVNSFRMDTPAFGNMMDEVSLDYGD